MSNRYRYLWGIGALLLLAACGVPGQAADTNPALSAIGAGVARQAVPSDAPLPSVPALPAVQPDAAQQAAMADPEQVTRLFAESIKQANFTAVEPLMTDKLRASLALTADGSVESFYQAQRDAFGPLVAYTIFNRHTVYDSDDLVAFDLDFQHERQLNPGKILLARGEAGWQIAALEDRAAPSLAEATPSEEQRAAMQDPRAVARLFAEQLKQKQYGQIEPLFSYFARQMFGPPGSIEAHYRDNARRYGPLLDYTIGEPRAAGEKLAEIEVTFIHEQEPLPSKVVLKQTPQGWKISRVVGSR